MIIVMIAVVVVVVAMIVVIIVIVAFVMFLIAGCSVAQFVGPIRVHFVCQPSEKRNAFFPVMERCSRALSARLGITIGSSMERCCKALLAGLGITSAGRSNSMERCYRALS